MDNVLLFEVDLTHVPVSSNGARSRNQSIAASSESTTRFAAATSTAAARCVFAATESRNVGSHLWLDDLAIPYG